MSARAPVALAAVALAVIGCGAEPASRVEIALPAASSSPPVVTPPHAAKVVVDVVRAPATVVVDGDLTEWAKPRAEGGSRIAVAFTTTGAYVAADLDEGAARGIWLGLGSDPVDPGPNKHTCTAPPADEREGEVCQQLADAHNAFLTSYRALFARAFRVEAEGLRVADARGALAPVGGAKLAWRPHAGGVRVEAWIPSAALPRLEQAPLSSVRACARAADAKPPADGDKDWVTVAVDPPVGFEPHAELRAHVYEAIKNRFCDDRLSYQPGEDRLIGAWSGSGPLYTAQATLGEVEVGFVRESPMTCHATGANGPDTEETIVAVLYRGKVIEVVDVGRVMGIVRRGDELHVVDFRSGYSDGEGWSYADWSAFAVARDGTVRLDLVRPVEQKVRPGNKRSFSKGPHAPDLTSFGVRGVVFDRDPRTGAELFHGIELTWRWDATAKAYVGREKAVGPPRSIP